MQSVAEIKTPYCIAIYRFNDSSKEEVAEVERYIGELADDGLVLGVEFHPEQ